MKCSIIAGFLMLFFLTGNTQNLVPNPSFEDTISCDQMAGWELYSNSPDYFNTCRNPHWSIPSNFFGYQPAKSGNAYAGLYTGLNDGIQYREAWGSQLSQALSSGTKYYVSFYVSRAYTYFIGGSGITTATNKLGVKFSNIPVTSAISIDNYAHVFTDSVITDTLNWVKIIGSFVADSNYQYLYFGNFYADSLTNFIQDDSIAPYAYYYWEDFCVSTDSIYCYNWTNISEIENTKFEIYPNPATDYITINAKDIQSLKFFDITGRLQKELVYQSENIDISDLSNGIYLVEIRDRKNTFYRKIIKN